MINFKDNLFHIQTQNTSYAFCISKSGYLRSLHYGERLEEIDPEPLILHTDFGTGNGIVDRIDSGLSLENTCFEVSTVGKGDIREHFVELVADDGIYVNQFLYESHEIINEGYTHETLAYAKANGAKAQILKINLVDVRIGAKLSLYYEVFENCDVIVKWSKITAGEKKITLKRLMSSQLDIENQDFTLHSLYGRWTNEANLTSQKIENQIVIDSKCGVSSSRHNPFFFIENEEEIYGFNLIYSGNHLGIVEKSSFDKLRILQGINDFHFEVELKTGQSFETPQAISTYTNMGRNQLQKQMHHFIHRHIIPQNFLNKPRPVLINSWEANYFDFDQGKLLRLAKKSKEIGVELFVLDDGWFGKRNDDTSSLGDWTVNIKKLPRGLKSLSDKLESMGLEFGLWVEPEMISVDSDLYRNHPEYAVKVDENVHFGRNQLILDLTNRDVIDYLKTTLTELFSSAKISYVKWDMNRIYSDMYGSTLPHQGSFFHETQKGLVELYTYLTEKFPDILFENCSSGGNRFDLSMLCFSPQIWASDNTDAYERLKIQKNLLLGYPQSTMGAHVSANVNHQTLRKTSLASRFHVACFGILGYELNLMDCSTVEIQQLKEQIAYYKAHRELFQYGMVTAKSFEQYTQFSVSNEDEGVIMVMQGLTIPHSISTKIKAPFALDCARVQVESRGFPIEVKDFGSLLDHISPIHIKPEGMIHNLVNKFYAMHTEEHIFETSPKQLEKAGFYLPQSFHGTGYNDQTRLFKDFDSRMYLVTKVD